MAGADPLLDRVRATGLLTPGARVLVLLSGGRDSVCLLGMALRLGAVPRALHLDYGLRGADSTADAELCASLCARLGVPLTVEHAHRPATGNLQAWAREVRYAAGARLAGPGELVATGHTATDQVEGVLYRLASSPGRRGLLGMPARTEVVVRPLLVLTREETAAWCAAEGLPWREDASNASPDYARNRIRAGLVPALRAVDPRAEENVLRTVATLADEAEVLDAVVAERLDGRTSLPVAELAALPPALARLAVRRLAEDATGAPCPRAPARLPELLAAVEPAGGGPWALDVGDGARAEVLRGALRFVGTPPGPSSPGGRRGPR